MGLVSFRHIKTWASAMVVAGVAVSAALVLPAPARADRDGFYLLNQADIAVIAVYVSPIFSKRWRDDRLADNALAPGAQAWVAVDAMTEGDCFYDIRVEDASGTPYEFWGIDLCATRTVTVP